MKKSNYLTFISLVSTLAVLILHTNGCFWEFSADGRYWKTANIIESVFYFAVPLFFMISGITLMDFFDRYSLKEYFWKRIRKTVIPFVAWSMIGLVEKIILHSVNISDINFKFLYQGITGNGFVSLYWFFTSLFIIYLSMPLYAAVEKEKRKNVFSYIVIAAFFLNLLVPFIKSIFHLDLNAPYSVTVAGGVLIWPLIGWLLHNCSLKRIHKCVIYIFSVIGLLVHLIGTYVLSMQAGSIVQTFKGYQNVPCILYSIGVFVLLKDIGQRVLKVNKIESFVTMLGKYTFPVYLMQFVFLDTLPYLSFVSKYSIIYRLGAPFVIIPIIIGITYIMRKIPIIKHIVPQ